MSTKSIFSLMASSLMVAALLCSALSSRSQTQTQSQSQPQPQLPEGNGREIVQRACTACHALNQVTNSGHDPEEWKIVMAMMVNVGAPITKAEAATVTDYLTQNFPEKPKPAAVVVAGNANVSIEEWEVPTPGSRPHDPLWTPDGNMWYSGHMANVLGRFDPRTQKFTEFHPKVPGSGPHGLVADKDGNIWFTANFKGYIGKLDPKTGDVTEYDLPDPNARDPHTPLFAPNGMLFFTVQSANMVGRLNPKTGEIKMVTSPTPKSNPYGMVMNSKGVPIFCEFGSNKIASIDPETLAIHEWVLPHEDSRPRRIAITADDAVWYSDYARGYLGRLDTKTGKVTNEWPSPSGPKCQPYAITAIGNVIWYVESNARPNTLVRFDSATERFQTWIIPAGGGVVRNMVHTPDGNLWFPESGVNKIAFVQVKGGNKISLKQ
jgi:virginiamycin B lyase